MCRHTASPVGVKYSHAWYRHISPHVSAAGLGRASVAGFVWYLKWLVQKAKRGRGLAAAGTSYVEHLCGWRESGRLVSPPGGGL